MGTFKWVVPAAVVTALALGLIGAASASAAETVLCEVEVSPCTKKWELTSFEAKAEPLKLLASGFGTVECASSTIKGGSGC